VCVQVQPALPASPSGVTPPRPSKHTLASPQSAADSPCRAPTPTVDAVDDLSAALGAVSLRASPPPPSPAPGAHGSVELARRIAGADKLLARVTLPPPRRVRVDMDCTPLAATDCAPDEGMSSAPVTPSCDEQLQEEQPPMELQEEQPPMELQEEQPPMAPEQCDSTPPMRGGRKAALGSALKGTPGVAVTPCAGKPAVAAAVVSLPHTEQEDEDARWLGGLVESQAVEAGRGGGAKKRRPGVKAKAYIAGGYAERESDEEEDASSLEDFIAGDDESDYSVADESTDGDEVRSSAFTAYLLLPCPHARDS
jgi:hypothetical protein